MSLVNMLTWWQWGVLAAIPPAIVLLYFLKLKRQPLAVPSTYLWQKSIEDLHVNSIWQRLRTSLLLLLQLLLVALLMLALTRPGWSGVKLEGTRYVFLVDNSASMSSTDVEPSRLAEAKRRVGELVEQMGSGDVAMIVSFSDSARVEQAFTDNRRQLQTQLEAIQPTNRPTSLDEALRVAAGLANAERPETGGDDAASASQPATLYVFSDGRFPDVDDFRLGNLQPVYVPIGSPAPANVGITAFNTRRREDDSQHVQAFGRLQNFGPADLKADVELYHDDALLDSTEVELDAGGSGGVVFDLGELPTGTLRLQAGSGGALALDDQAWGAVEPPSRARVLLVTPGNDALELALATESALELAEFEVTSPDALATKEYRDAAASGYYALVIYDQCHPESMPRADTLFIGELPPESSWKAAEEQVEAPQIIDVENRHPLLQLIDMSNVRFAEATILAPPEGATVLITTERGPLFAIAPRGGFEDAVLGGEIVGTDEAGAAYANTDWPLRVSFPVFVLNALRYFGHAAAGEGIPSVRPGGTIALRGEGSAETLRVRKPSGETMALARQAGETFYFGDTAELGIYAIEEEGRPARHFAVNLFDSAESDIPPRQDVQIGYEKLSGQAVWEGGRFELWKPLLIAVLCVLCLEWYIYNRRIHV
ncbi:MAG: VWA domain-containing protein [Planctomycetota bacterium]|nr:MAG: VWA domain-containing protein [Planctomycetota bacterium]